MTARELQRTRPAPGMATKLDAENEVQPDALLRIETERGGRSTVSDEGYLKGAPELVAVK